MFKEETSISDVVKARKAKTYVVTDGAGTKLTHDHLQHHHPKEELRRKTRFRKFLYQ